MWILLLVLLFGLIRYPGGKSKGVIHEEIIQKLDKIKTKEYREPFVGAFGIGIKFIQQNPDISKVWINDLDPGIASLWNSIIHNPKDLSARIENFTPSVQAFHDFKQELLRNSNLSDDIGFKKLAVHQMSFSGLGAKAGGCMGGANQTSNYKVDCRFDKDRLQKTIFKLYKHFKTIQIEVTCLDFEQVLGEGNYTSYVDPPYYQKGNELYQHSFRQIDHIRLQYLLQHRKQWLLSYDNCEQIRSLYEWAQVEEVTTNYSICSSRKKTELLIFEKS